jgi:hypothetical protein
LDFCTKKDTRAILLKIALVHVSCIQNTEIRVETIAKVFRKVDMFWTYQASGDDSPLRHGAGKSFRTLPN